MTDVASSSSSGTWTRVPLQEVRIRGKSFPARGEEALPPVLRFNPEGLVQVSLDADFTDPARLLSFQWKDVTAMGLTYAGPPKCRFSFTLEPRKPLPHPTLRRVHVLTLLVPSEHMHLLEKQIEKHKLTHRLETGIPSWMVQMPYEKYYSKELRNIFYLCSNFVQLVLAATFSYQLYLSLPGWVAQMQASVATSVYEGLIAPAWEFAYAHPTIGLAGGLIALVAFWPLFMMWWIFALGGAILLRFSFLLYLLISLVAYVPVLASNVKSIGRTIPQLYSAFAFIKRNLQTKKKKDKRPTDTAAKTKKDQ